MSSEDYAAIEAAVMETARGRWFLMEYARRNRQADTTLLLEALARLERNLGRPAGADPDFRLRRDLSDMAETLQQTKKELALSLAESIGNTRPTPVERVYDEMVQSAERADTEAFNAAEHVQEIAWSLREGIQGTELCDDLDRHAIEIYRASNQHALATKRVRAILTVLRGMEAKLHGMVGDSQGPQLVDDGEVDWEGTQSAMRSDLIVSSSQSVLRDDVVFADAEWTSERRKQELAPANDVYETSSDLPAFEPAKAQLASESMPVTGAFAKIDSLPDERKLALFV